MFSVFMVFLAALTEAGLYFIVRDLKTKNNWNHLFISYFFGAILLTGSLFGNIKRHLKSGLLTGSFVLNIVIGLMGYLLRFLRYFTIRTIHICSIVLFWYYYVARIRFYI